MATSNHIHLLVLDGGTKKSRSMQLAVGRIGQQFNQRKKPKRAFREGQCNVTAMK